MAVGTMGPQETTASAGKRFLVGTNVLFASLLVAGIVVVAQMIAYALPVNVDMTTSGVNSLSVGTENLLRNLDGNVRLTSLYFETDREEKDQPRYRQAARGLIDLYEATNRGKVKAEWINPLKDLEEYQALTTRLRELPAFKSGVDAYREPIETFQKDIAEQAQALIQSEMQAAAEAGGGAIGGEGRSAGPAARIELTFRSLNNALDGTRDQIEALMPASNPQYSAATSELRSFYPQVSKVLKDIGKFGADAARQTPDLSPKEVEFLQTAGNRYADLVAKIEAENTKVQELESLKVDTILGQLTATSNAIIAETDENAQLVDFGSVWPPMDQGMGGGQVPFDKRAFKGEEELTAAILRVTHQQQTAVVFVRFGGQPLFMGGFMPNQPPAPYAMMKEQLEDANFVVQEWDLKTSETPPAIDPAPTRTIFVVLKPEAPDRNMMMQQQPQELPFSDRQRDAFLKAFGDKGRALFIAGWYPGPFGPVPGAYEYNDYLTQNWGIHIENGEVLLNTISTGPGQFGATRDAFNVDGLEIDKHPIVNGPVARQLVLPWCAPLKLSEKMPEGVQADTLVTAPERDDLWAVKDLSKYQQQVQQREYLTREATDTLGPFTLAAAATKGDSKVVVISSRSFAMDDVAFARAMSLTPQGFMVRSRNPGNVVLLINSLHWLNDNTEFMNIGQPIDAAVLTLPGPTTVKAVQVLTIFVWPALALALGGVTWLIRRR